MKEDIIQDIIDNIYFLNAVLAYRGNRIIYIINSINNFLLKKDYSSIDEILKRIEIDKIGEDDIVAMMIITFDKRGDIRKRDRFIEKCVKEKGINKERVEICS